MHLIEAEVGNLELRTMRQQERALDDVLELAHVARPAMTRERTARFGADPLRRQPHRASASDHEGLGERQDLPRSLAQRRHTERDSAEPEVEVLAKSTVPDLILESPV